MVVVAVAVFQLIFFFGREKQLQPQIEAAKTRQLPAGVMEGGNGKLIFRDFHLHRAFVERIWKKVTVRPYTQEGQKEIFKNWIPSADRGLPHPYSPVIALILAPFVWMGPWMGYYLYA